MTCCDLSDIEKFVMPDKLLRHCEQLDETKLETGNLKLEPAKVMPAAERKEALRVREWVIFT